MLLNRNQMTELAGDREVQATRALADASNYPNDSTEARFATQCAAELREHADQLRRGINPYESDDRDLWIPRAGER